MIHIQFIIKSVICYVCGSVHLAIMPQERLENTHLAAWKHGNAVARHTNKRYIIRLERKLLEDILLFNADFAGCLNA